MSRSVENKIIEATVECIEEYGLQNTTSRRIGKKAGVNSAAINYYFRSKDVLMERVMEVTLNNAFCWEDYKHTEELGLKEQLYKIFSHLASSALRFPKISQAHLYDVMTEYRDDLPVLTPITDFMNKILEEICRKEPGITRDRAYDIVMQLMSSVVFYYVMLPKIYDRFCGRDMSRSSVMEKYIRNVIDTLLK